MKKLAELIFPNISKVPQDYLKLYPIRNLENDAKVTRYAPSPTGFQHIGGIFAALVAERIAKQSKGVFYLRIEDTDQKREVEGAIDDTIETMHKYGMYFDEGMTGQLSFKGEYGPYRQSERKEIYQTFAKDLIVKGLAYPCFTTSQELDELRKRQVEEKLTPGYYGEFAKYHNLSEDEYIEKIKEGTPYIIRFKSDGDFEKRVEFHDEIKGDISFPENNQDVVIIKGDGLPTYHFAHVIDDTLMRTTHVTRGEEWLPSLPIHVQLFEAMGYPLPKFGHIPTIRKQEGDSRRKLSKRKDPESAVTYYEEEGYPAECVIEYLLNLINSSYEQWRTDNPLADYHTFIVHLDKMSKNGALFDIVKLNDMSKDIIAKMPVEKVYNYYIVWAEKFDKEMFELVFKHKEQTEQFLDIDKDTPKPRKDFAKWNEVRDKIKYLFDEFFYKEPIEKIELPKGVSMEQAQSIVKGYKKVYNPDVNSQEQWFEDLKQFAIDIGYCANRKEYKNNPDKYKGMVSDVAGAVRSAITHRNNSPDLYTIMKILGEERTKERFEKFCIL
ncbi:glutamate--tRNA ligase [Candidatus Epulonipiscium fishelsonii]|uniref:Glutamate--tRNA ligase n=1 Tax=Candidatus Epulonipiscium fishelsonii TaxID=77094 RepID=A0ACC8XBT3_9FIRM|nr:glutamate--tRNA ligase [Epulopiscium sp. SCG-B11WGA-EpuloA1]ONI41917.1 glutamate--tRNA ligase [Epulopiscium sp. SCG-B05WGA-EpuloA1]